MSVQRTAAPGPTAGSLRRLMLPVGEIKIPGAFGAWTAATGVGVEIAKMSDDTPLIVGCLNDAFVTGGALTFYAYASINGTLYEIGRRRANETDNNKQMGGFAEITGLDAGVYDVQLYVKNPGGAPWLGMNDLASLTLLAWEGR